MKNRIIQASILLLGLGSLVLFQNCGESSYNAGGLVASSASQSKIEQVSSSSVNLLLALDAHLNNGRIQVATIPTQDQPQKELPPLVEEIKKAFADCEVNSISNFDENSNDAAFPGFPIAQNQVVFGGENCPVQMTTYYNYSAGPGSLFLEYKALDPDFLALTNIKEFYVNGMGFSFQMGVATASEGNIYMNYSITHDQLQDEESNFTKVGNYNMAYYFSDEAFTVDIPLIAPTPVGFVKPEQAPEHQLTKSRVYHNQPPDYYTDEYYLDDAEISLEEYLVSGGLLLDRASGFISLGYSLMHSPR